MAWRALTSDDVKSSLTAIELAAFSAIARQAGGADPMAKALSRTTGEVRGYIAGCERNTLGEDGTIPDECIGAASDLAAWYIVTGPGIRLNSDLIEARKEKKNDAVKFLQRIASCDVKIAQPITPSADVIPRSEFVRTSGNTRQSTRSKMSGL